MLSRHSVLKIAINVIIFDTFTEVSEIYTVTFSALNNTQTVLLPLWDSETEKPLTFKQGHYSTVTTLLKVFNDIANALYCNPTKMFWAITERLIRVYSLYPKRSASLWHQYSAKIVLAMIQPHSTEKATSLECEEFSQKVVFSALVWKCSLISEPRLDIYEMDGRDPQAPMQVFKNILWTF